MPSCSMVGPDYRMPPALIPEKWEEEGEGVTQEQELNFAWWEYLGDDSLNALVAIGYNQNLPLMIAGLRVMQARAELGIAIGNWFPQQQQLGGNYAANRTSFPDPDTYFNLLSTGVDIAWEIDVGESLGEAFNQQDQYVQVQGDIITSLIALYRALGGGLRCCGFIPCEMKGEMRERTSWGELLCD